MSKLDDMELVQTATDLSCSEASELFSEYLLDVLPQDKAHSVEKHVLACDRCSSLLVATRIAVGHLIAAGN